jgi:hypothetical protein
VNRAPVVTSVPPVLTNVGDIYEYELTAADPDNDVLYWVLESGPKGMVLDAPRLDSVENDGLFQTTLIEGGSSGDLKSGKLRWQPEITQLGEHEVRVLWGFEFPNL